MPGYEANFTHPLLKRHECPICLFAMRNPVQTECGHLFCRDCLEPVLERRHPICPLDKEKITQEGTFPDNACRRDILKLQVKCKFQDCPWVGALKSLEDHLSTCEYRDEQCTQCGQYIQHLDMRVHQTEQCPMRPTTFTQDVLTQQFQSGDFQKPGTEIPNGAHALALPTKRPLQNRLNQHEISLLLPQEEKGYDDSSYEIDFNTSNLAALLPRSVWMVDTRTNIRVRRVPEIRPPSNN